MDKRLILKYIKGEASELEKEKLLRWLNEGSRNREYFAKLNDLCLYTSMPAREADATEMGIAGSIMTGASKKNGVTPLPQPEKKKRIVAKIAYYGAAAAIFIALCTNIYLMQKKGSENLESPLDRHVLATLPQGYLHTIYTTRGVKGEVTLPDGSKVKLNSDSKLIFPDKFNGGTREVYMSGEAYFNVTTNPDTPMIVNTNRNFLVKVYGTEFNLRAYENELSARTTLFKGKVDLISKDRVGEMKVLAALKPRESFEFREKLPPLKVIKADTLKQGAWRHGNLLFEHTPMDEVIRELERWHGAEFIVKDKAIYDLKFSASFKQESLVQILDIIKFCSDINYELSENKVTLSLKK